MQETATTITVSKKLAEELERSAQQQGKDRETLLHDLLEQLSRGRGRDTAAWTEAINIQKKIQASSRGGGIVGFIRHMRETRYGR